MSLDYAQIGAAAVTVLATYLQDLIEMGKAQVKRLVGRFVDSARDATWNKARAIWERLTTRVRDDQEVASAVTMVATKPDDETRQKVLATVLGERLQAYPELAQEIFDLLGGQEAIQEVLADRSSWVEDVVQDLKGTGRQSVRASEDSVIKNARQIKR